MSVIVIIYFHQYFTRKLLDRMVSGLNTSKNKENTSNQKTDNNRVSVVFPVLFSFKTC